MSTYTAPATGTPVRTPDGIGVFEGVTGHLYAVAYPDGIPAIGMAPGSVMGYAPVSVHPVTSATPILDTLISEGHIWAEGHLYTGRASDGALMAMPGSVARADQTEAYLTDFPTPAHW